MGRNKDEDSDIQSWSEVPSIAHFCSLFRQAFDLLEFDIQELEESLLLMGTDDDTSQLVLRLLIRLLRGCSKTFTNNINEDNYNTYLRRLFLSKREEAEEDHFSSGPVAFECKALLDHDVDFPDLSLRNRVRILQQLTEYRLDAEDVFEKVKNLEAGSLRVDALGTDSDSVTYWYFYGTRLYKEDAAAKGKMRKPSKKKRKKDKKKKKKKKSRRESTTTTEEDDDEGGGGGGVMWSVACLTLQDWDDIAAKYKRSKRKCDRELYETIHDNFLPEIVKMFAEKEREERRKLLALAPKRTSSRIERKRREQEERDRLMAEKLEEERRMEEEYDGKVREERIKREEDEREMARDDRIRQRDVAKEIRAKRAAERAVERDVSTVLVHEQLKLEKSEGLKRDEVDVEDLYNPYSGGKDNDSDEDYKPSREEISEAASSSRNNSKENSSKSSSSSLHFTNALLRVGSKSTKDVLLDKPVRKSPGLLLESAGQSLLQRRTASSNAADSKFNSLLGLGGEADPATAATSAAKGLSFGLCRPEKISFGLYGGNLSVDSGAPKSSTTHDDVVAAAADPGPVEANGSSKPQPTATTTKKVFSNWGGEFFKRNLDYRANTNKILEKMNLTVAVGGSTSTSALANGEGLKSLSSSSPTKRPFDVMSKLSSQPPPSGSSDNGGGGGGGSPMKKLKGSGAFFSNSKAS